MNSVSEGNRPVGITFLFLLFLVVGAIRGPVSLGGARAPRGERREEARALTILGQKWTRA